MRLISRREKLSMSAMLDRLEDGLSAKNDRGYPDHAVRHKWWTDSMRIHGVLDNKTEQIAQAGNHFNIVAFLNNGIVGKDGKPASIKDFLPPSQSGHDPSSDDGSFLNRADDGRKID